MSDAKYRTIFNKADLNGDGTLDIKEFQGLLAVAIGKVPDPELAAEIHKQIDADHNGKISFEEYLAFVTKPANHLGALLQAFDANGDGYLSVSELSALLKLWGQDKTDAEVKKILDDSDANKDGKVTLAEFIAKFKQ